MQEPVPPGSGPARDDECMQQLLTVKVLNQSSADIDHSYMPMVRSLTKRQISLDTPMGHRSCNPNSSEGFKTTSTGVPSLSYSSMPVYYHAQLATHNELFNVMEPFIEQNGFFLLRDSFTKPGRLTISVIHDGGVKHFNIALKDGMYTIDEKRLFSSIDELVTFYGAYEVPNLEGISNIRLKFPVVVRSPASPSSSNRNGLVVLEESQLTTDEGSARAINSSPRFPENGSSASNFTFTNVMPVDYRTQNIAPGQDLSSRNDERALDSNSVVTQAESATRHQAVKERSTFTKKIKKFFKSSSVGAPQSSSSNHVVQNYGSSDIASTQMPTNLLSKPPAPLPPDAFHQVGRSDESSDTSLYYSNARDLDCRLSYLISSLRSEDEEDTKCHCGLSYDEAKLPLGWSLHLSTDAISAGRVFFTSPNGKTSWELPLEVSIELDVEQKQRIRRLLAMSDNRQTVTKRQQSINSESTSLNRQPSALSSLSSSTLISEESPMEDVRLTSASSSVQETGRDLVSRDDIFELGSSPSDSMSGDTSGVVFLDVADTIVSSEHSAE